MKVLIAALTWVIVALHAAPVAAAASLSGTLRNDAGSGIAGLQVRLWGLTSKGYVISDQTLSDGSGNYTFSGAAANTYKLDARMPPGFSGNYGDRWYDVAAPMSDGWIGGDADVITLDDGAALTGYDITLLVLGGLDACVVNTGGVPAQGLRVRVERIGERRIHHNDLTKTTADPTHEGCFYMRGMVPGTDYRIIISDPRGIYETVVLAGPYTIAAGLVTSVGTIPIAPNAVFDRYEDNDFAADLGSDSIDPSLFQQTPPQAFVTSGALVGVVPDLDWYCFQAGAGARFIVTVDAFIDLGGNTLVDHPFFDPMLGFWSETANAIVAANDDAAVGVWNSRLVGEARDGAGRYCAVVTSFPDLDFTGVAQGSAGTYVLSVTPTNRRPVLAATRAANPVPEPPAVISIAEDEAITLDLTFSDPDGDALTVVSAHTNNVGVNVGEATFNLGAGVADWSWTPSQVAAAGSPYTVTFTAADSELSVTVTVIIEVTGVNVAPTVPVHLSPLSDTAVDTATPELRIDNSTDVDLNTLVYEFELYDVPPGAVPVQSATVSENASGKTGWQTAALTENATYTWRVRAYDGQIDNPYSPYTTAWSFFVDVTNEPPAAPVMNKPVPGQPVLVRMPTLEAFNPLDPENDALDMFFEVATDVEFNDMVTASPALAVGATSNTTPWPIDVLLDWTAVYFARAKAVDARGGIGPYSDVLSFALRDNQVPPTPELAAPYETGCDAGVAVTFPLAPIEVKRVDEPDGDPLWLDLEVYRANDAINTNNAVAMLRRPQVVGTTTTAFAVGSGAFKKGEVYLVRARADDLFAQSAWDVCQFTAPPTGGGAPSGCGCAGAAGGDALLILGALWLVRRRRRG